MLLRSLRGVHVLAPGRALQRAWPAAPALATARQLATTAAAGAAAPTHKAPKRWLEVKKAKKRARKLLERKERGTKPLKLPPEVTPKTLSSEMGVRTVDILKLLIRLGGACRGRFSFCAMSSLPPPPHAPPNQSARGRPNSP